MPKILLINPEADPASGQLRGTHWQLPDETDTDELRERLKRAITEGGAVSVPVLLPGSSGPPTKLTLNAAMLTSVAVLHLANGDSADHALGEAG